MVEALAPARDAGSGLTFGALLADEREGVAVAADALSVC
jgi:hypothetical protein